MFVMYSVRRHIEHFIQKSAWSPQTAKGCLKLRGICELENSYFSNILKCLSVEKSYLLLIKTSERLRNAVGASRSTYDKICKMDLN